MRLRRHCRQSVHHLLVSCCFVVAAAAAASSSSSLLSASSSSLPWQDDDFTTTTTTSYASASGRSRNNVDNMDYTEFPPTVFDPSGRLIAVETILPRTYQPYDPSHTLVVAIHCRQGIVIVSSVPTSPYLGLLHPAVPPRWKNASRGRSYNHSRADTDHSNRTSTSSTQEPAVQDDQEPIDSLFLSSRESSSEPDTRIMMMMTPPPFVRLSASLFGVTAGNAVDSQVVRRDLYEISQNLRQRQEEQETTSTSRGSSSSISSTITTTRRATTATSIDSDLLKEGDGSGGSPTSNSHSSRSNAPVTATITTTTTTTTQVIRGRAVARLWADRLQARTQQGQAGRLLATSVILVDAAAAAAAFTARDEKTPGTQDNDDVDEPSFYDALWQVDPTGVFYACQAAVAGRASPMAHELLLQLVQEKYLSKPKQPSSSSSATITTNQDDGDDNRETWSTKSPSDGADDSDLGDRAAPSRPRPRRRRHVRQALYDLTCTEALQLATQVVQSTLTKVTTAARTTLQGEDDIDEHNVRAGVTRIRGLVIRHRTNTAAPTTAITNTLPSSMPSRMQWYTQRELEALLARNGHEEN